MSVNLQVAEIALDRADGTAFEKFFHAFFCGLIGADFVPLGGVHDGGADAFQDKDILVGKRSGYYYQASIEKDHKSKIRRTIKRLREFGREPIALQYVSSRSISTADKDAEILSEETGVHIQIRNRSWIIGNLNQNDATIQSFESFLRPFISFLEQVGGSTFHIREKDDVNRSICVFLGQEIRRRGSKTDLLEAVTDTLILWALEGTDPNEEKFLTKNQIVEKIERVIPTARHFVRGSIDHRLNQLSKKGNPSGREIRYYARDKKYCLPFETRELVRQENIEDENLRINVLSIFESRITKGVEDDKMHEYGLNAYDLSEMALQSIELTFEKEGLELAGFLSGEVDSDVYSSISDQIDTILDENQFVGDRRLFCKEILIGIIRQSFYQSAEEERVYFGKISRSYTLLYTISSNPDVINYFRSMSKHLVLYVGTDIIVGALSERYLRPEDQMRVNLLGILIHAGSQLILSEHTLDEVYTHIAATDYEFKYHYQEMEPYVDMDLARHCSKILIRAYFYAKLDPLPGVNPPNGWRFYINQICDHGQLHSPVGREQLRDYLLDRFGLEFASYHDLDRLTDKEEVEELSHKISGIKNNEQLAKNDARQILAIYGKRNSLNEGTKPNPYGYRTWWLTHESRVRPYTTEIVRKMNSQYIIRPEFILNFIALAPELEDIRATYQNVFPTILGIRLSNRMREPIFIDVMDKLKEFRDYDDARIRVIASDLSNKLKGDRFKRYQNNLQSLFNDRT